MCDTGENAIRNGARSQKSQDEQCKRGQGEHGRAQVECQVAICCDCVLSASALWPRLISCSGPGQPLPFQNLLTEKPEERETPPSIFRKCMGGLWNAVASAERAPCSQAGGEAGVRISSGSLGFFFCSSGMPLVSRQMTGGKAWTFEWVPNDTSYQHDAA
jgi:hypothetical protein